MSDPSYALQKALVARLKATPPLAALVGNRVFDAVPKGAAFPYLTLGPAQIVPDEGDCYDGASAYFDVHVWSRAGDFGEAKRIGPLLSAAVLADGLALDGHRLLSMASDGINYMRDPDGDTYHGVFSFLAETEPA